MQALNGKNLKEIMQKDVVFIDFWASWCGPCMAFAPTFEEVANLFDGKADFVKCNVDEQREFALKQGIMGIPTVLAFKNGKVVGKKVGSSSLDEFVEFVQSILK